ncbi:DMT family transporter [Erythrobacter sp.]|uniref:DMT family transporter n=1 Tax=Erythrobacter sp. TaxID=1042 RepID=UPI001B2DAD2E|nr:DMT family transporter [Erythrobacter sp.]MBO6526929.1 DMT family transporter [Erythrobacter sp.]MBO6528601.1 DMT family transporter [Erythrobacter sp.]
MPLRALLIMTFCNVVWALNVVVSKIAIADLATPPLFYALLRSVIVAVVLVPLLRPLPAKLWRVLVIGLAISGGSFALLFMGLETASPSAAGVVSLTGAPMTVLFAILFLGERVRWRRGLGIGLAFGGVLFAMAGDNQMETSTGLLLVFLSAVVGALGSVFVKRLEIPSIRLQAWAAVASVAVLIPLTAAMESGQAAALSNAPWELAACLFFAAIVVSVGAHTAYYRLLQEHDANLVVPLTLFTPILTIVFGAWLTGDAIGERLVIGGAIALAGVAIIVLRPSETFTRRFLVRPRF